MNEQENPLAFPCPDYRISEGMKLRDYFATKAMTAYITSPDRPKEYLEGIGYEDLQELIAEASYDMADAMLKQRNK